MPHTVTVTRTTTTSTSAMIWNCGYCTTVPGLLKIAEIIVGGIILFMLLVLLEDKVDLTYNPFNRLHAVFFFHYIVVTFFIGSILLLLGCLASLSSGSIIAKTSYEFIYHGGACILYFLATLWLIFQVKDYRYETYRLYFFSMAFGALNTVLYGISCVLAYRAYRF